MRAVQLHQPGPASSLKLVEIPIPTPKPGEVPIKVKAFDLNFAELIARRTGRASIDPLQLPRTLGVEAVGLVKAVPGSEEELPKGATVMAALRGWES